MLRAPEDHERLAGLARGLHAALLLEDEHGRVALVNDAFCGMFGIPLPPEQLAGAVCSEMAAQARDLFAEPDAFVARVEEIQAARRPVEDELLRLADGRVLERDYAPIEVDGAFRGHYWMYWDMTHRERERDALHRSDEAATALGQIAADREASPEARLARVLEAGMRLLRMPIGLVAEIEDHEAEIVVVHDPSGQLQLGMRRDLDHTFVREAVRSGRPVGFHRASGTRWAELPAFRDSGIEAWVGAAVLVHGEVRGALTFAAREPRAEPFTERELNLLELMAQWIGAERERLLAREQLMASEARAAATVATALDGVITISLDERVLEFSPAAEQIFGWTRDEALGRPLSELIIPPEHRDAHARGIARYLETHEPRALNRRLELPALRADGTRITVELAAGAIEVEGEPVAFTAYLRDISDRKQFEADLAVARDDALEAARLKSEFLATMSHEIRTPMNGVVGAIDLLRDTQLDPHQAELAGLIQESAHALTTIVDDILDTAKIEAGKISLASEPFDVRAVIEGAAEVPAAQARAKGLAVATLVHDDVPAELVGDAGRLRQILVNLVGNAVKFTDEGWVIVEARLVRRVGAHARLEVTIGDTGIGIEPEIQERLFRPFAQADASSTRRHGGTGLGLVISDQLAQLMGGGIELESAPGRGTTMTVTVDLAVGADAPPPERPLAGRRLALAGPRPELRRVFATKLAALGAQVVTLETPEQLRAGTDAEAALVSWSWREHIPAGLPAVVSGGPPGLPEEILRHPLRTDRLVARLDEVAGRAGPEPAPAGASVAPPRPRARVLVAEDSEVNRTLLVRQLERIGVSADVVENGREAVRAARTGAYPLILMDCRMPEMDGFEAARAIRDAEPGGAHTPIVAFTANATSADRRACLEAGMDDHLAKPVTLEMLRGVMARWLHDDEDAAPAAPAPDLDPGIPAQLGDLAGDLGGSEPVVRLTVRWEEELPARLEALRAASAAGDAGVLRDTGHTLRGASRIFGAERVGEACATLEAQAEDGPAVTGPLVDAIEAAAEDARRAMRAWASDR